MITLKQGKKGLGAFLCEHLFSVSASHEINSLIFGNVQEADGHHVCFTETYLLLFFPLPLPLTVTAVELNIFKFDFLNETVRDAVDAHVTPTILFALIKQNSNSFRCFSAFRSEKENHSWVCLVDLKIVLIDF